MLIPMINRENEVRVGCGKFGPHNTLCDERTWLLYVNNMFPYVKKDVRQLGDILVNKGLLDEEDWDRVKRELPTKKGGDVSPRPYVESFKKFIDQVIVYLEVFGFDEGVGALKGISEKHGPPYNYQTLTSIVSALKCRDSMSSVWSCMHTERLLIFDKYYDVDEGKLKDPDECLEFVSRLDMCEACERLMIDTLGKMKRCHSDIFFRGLLEEKRYKILVGSFIPYPDSRDRDDESELLKVPLKIE